MTNISDQLSAAQYRQVHDICGRFEAARRDGQSPQVETLLDDTTGPLRDVLLAELIERDLELQAHQERFPQPVSLGISETYTGTSAVTVQLLNQYQQRFPDDLTVIAGAIDRFLKREVISGNADLTPQHTRYEFVAEIARGGAGVVWRVYDRHMKRETAVKLLLDSNNNSEMRRRLQLEARLSGRLQHPGIVPVHELSQLNDGRPFITMKLVKGDTLAQILKASPAFDQQRLLQATLQACEAVGDTHSQGVIHRDLKPENIILGEFNVAQVMDCEPFQFGWARSTFRERMMFSVAVRGLLNSPSDASAMQQAVEFGIELQQQQRDDIRGWRDEDQAVGRTFLRDIRDGLLTNQIRILQQQNCLTEQAGQAFEREQKSVEDRLASP